MFEEHFKQTEKVRQQLLDGAITYEEWFNKTTMMAVELTNTAEYLKHISSTDHDDKLNGLKY